MLDHHGSPRDYVRRTPTALIAASPGRESTRRRLRHLGCPGASACHPECRFLFSDTMSHLHTSAGVHLSRARPTVSCCGHAVTRPHGPARSRSPRLLSKISSQSCEHPRPACQHECPRHCGRDSWAPAARGTRHRRAGCDRWSPRLGESGWSTTERRAAHLHDPVAMTTDCAKGGPCVLWCSISTVYWWTASP